MFSTGYNGPHMFPLHDPLEKVLRDELASYDDLTAALLARRGIASKEAAERFLNPSYDSHLHDPFLQQHASGFTRRERQAVDDGVAVFAVQQQAA